MRLVIPGEALLANVYLDGHNDVIVAFKGVDAGGNTLGSLYVARDFYKNEVLPANADASDFVAEVAGDEKFRNKNIYVTGYSLGGEIA
jgi:hypothetical protein